MAEYDSFPDVATPLDTHKWPVQDSAFAGPADPPGELLSLAQAVAQVLEQIPVIIKKSGGPLSPSASTLLIIQNDGVTTDAAVATLVSGATGNSQLTMGTAANLTAFQVIFFPAALAMTINIDGTQRLALTNNGDLALTASIILKEITAPAAPAVNEVKIYPEDDGAGKTRLMALFNTGVAQQFAKEP